MGFKRKGKKVGTEVKPPVQPPALHGTKKVWEMKNEAFETYYREQKICDSPEEYDEFFKFCKKGLPCGLRINGLTGKQGLLLKQQLESLMETPEEGTTVGGKESADHLGSVDKATGLEQVKEGEAAGKGEVSCREALQPKVLEWFPRKLGYQFDHLSARHIKKDQSFKALKEFLMHKEVYGGLQRQETVSMIPPMLLDIQKDDLVLDMCAAPGSKTCQMLENLHWESGKEVGDFTFSKGGVVANEIEWKRANMLTHQTQRIGSPGIAVTQIDAQYFPSFKNESCHIKFDKILADVPCSGDGTLRKSPNIWKTWTCSDGLGLHIRQFLILSRGLEMLKPGGKLVYSTCSLNPIENEAVVRAALIKFGSCISLVSPPELPGWKYKEGLLGWKVPHAKKASFYNSMEEVEKENKVKESMFCFHGKTPSTEEEWGKSREENVELKKCRRFLPHLMNTGGFFCAIFTKSTDFVSSREKREKRGEPALKKAKVQEVEPNHFERVDVSSAEWENIRSFYGPFSDESVFYKRPHVHGDNKIYAISEKLYEAMATTKGNPAHKILSAGVRVFQQMESFGGECTWRVTQDGLKFLTANGFNRRLIPVPITFLEKILEKRILSTNLCFNFDKHPALMPREVENAEGGKAGESKAKEDGSKEAPGGLKITRKEAEERYAELDPTPILKDGKFQQGSAVLFEKDLGISCVVLLTRKNVALYVDQNQSKALKAVLYHDKDLKKQFGLM